MKLRTQLATLGTIATLGVTSLAITAQPAQAGKVRDMAEKVLIHNGLTPMDNCPVNAVSAILELEQVCALPNHQFSSGTYRIRLDNFALVPYGMTNQGAAQAPSAPPAQPVPSQPAQTVYATQPVQPVAVPQTTQPYGSGSIYSMSGQPISPPVIAKLRSLLAGNNIAEAACGSTPQQVTVTVNNNFVICGHPTSQYPAGNYKFTLGGLY